MTELRERIDACWANQGVLMDSTEGKHSHQSINLFRIFFDARQAASKVMFEHIFSALKG